MADKAAQDMQAMKLRDRSEESAREEVSHPPKIDTPVVVTANQPPREIKISPPPAVDAHSPTIPRRF